MKKEAAIIESSESVTNNIGEIILYSTFEVHELNDTYGYLHLSNGEMIGTHVMPPSDGKRIDLYHYNKGDKMDSSVLIYPSDDITVLSYLTKLLDSHARNHLCAVSRNDDEYMRDSQLSLIGVAELIKGVLNNG